MASLLVNIDVPDLERGIDFYKAALGLSLGRRIGTGVAELLGFPSPIYLLEKAEGSVAAPSTKATRSYKRHWTPVHLDIAVDDLDKALARARPAGAVLESEPASAEWGRIAMLADPFGNGFCLIQFSDRGYDAITTSDTTGASKATA